MRFTTASGLQTRIMKVACQMDCDNIQSASQGKSSKQVNVDLKELMVIHEFIPYWNIEQLRAAECYLNEKYKI